MCTWDGWSERYTECDGKTRCYCSIENEYISEYDLKEDQDEMIFSSWQLKKQRENERNFDPPEYIMDCKVCKNPIECCECPGCDHCKEYTNITIVTIKCPIPMCHARGDKVCVYCKNVHDRNHGL